MVESKTSKRPHYVFAQKTGKYLHAKIVQDGLLQIYVNMRWLAVGEKTKKLGKCLEWIQKRNAPLNLTTLVMFDSSKEVGKKKSKASMGCRKGGRSGGNPKELCVTATRRATTITAATTTTTRATKATTTATITTAMTATMVVSPTITTTATTRRSTITECQPS
jgi:hypothetical protein